ncbi:MAG: Succinate dehydrogenase 2 membrane subunit SdhC [Chloroflexi bacterium]|nr:Succinate dehydrogenase 2 membrane subunit SdhC [Chloroflexota bacterium]
MTLDRKVGLLAGLRYKGGGPMLAWILHRITGLGMIVFIALHVIASLLGGDIGIAINTVYQSLYFQLFVVFGIIFHGVNGLRIIVLDLWPKFIEYQRESTWLEWFIILPVYGLTAFVMISRFLAGE